MADKMDGWVGSKKSELQLNTEQDEECLPMQSSRASNSMASN